ncbi:family 16 glycosylhydrolase [Actinocorallia aurantiaca]|uniref:GH16 domain-containing protein n=1 Tax=Actinocorallia aurantiaca TaxID=46204 RepID=A0ABP6H8F5_9ACTN
MAHSLRRALSALAAPLLAVTLATIPAAPAHADDTPPSPLDKPGYTLDFSEEFDGTTLDTDRWLPYYLPHWTSEREKAKARYTIADGVLTERIDADTPAWNSRYDTTVKISSIQTYNKDWWHRFNGSMPNDHHEPDFNGYTTKYGYFEIRAKNSNVGGGGHQALWLVGTDDTTSASANPEIDMVETFFNKPNNWRIAAYGWGNPDFLSNWYLSDAAVPSGSPTTEYHTYGMEWTPTELKFYYDGQLYRTIPDAPNMPMGMIMGIYTDAGSGQHNDVWPKTWSVDYVRVWKKNGGYPESYYRLKNRETGQYVDDDGSGTAKYGALPATDLSTQWAVENAEGGHVRFKNRETGAYLHMENQTGNVQTGTVPGTYWSAQWTRETVDDRIRLKNRWKGTYAHTESRTGSVQYGNAPPGWWTSQWTLEPVG